MMIDPTRIVLQPEDSAGDAPVYSFEYWMAHDLGITPGRRRRSPGYRQTRPRAAVELRAFRTSQFVGPRPHRSWFSQFGPSDPWRQVAWVIAFIGLLLLAVNAAGGKVHLGL